MPEMDGREATRKIRALDGPRAGVQIIALTANAFADDIKACHDAGMNDFVAKPLRKKTLVEKLTKIVADRPQLHQQAIEAYNNLPLVPPAAVAMTDVAPILDRTEFNTLVEEIYIDGVRITLDAFLAETVQRLALLRTLPCNVERTRVKDEAHALKGSSGTLGFVSSRSWRGHSNMRRIRLNRGTIKTFSIVLRPASDWRELSWMRSCSPLQAK